MTRIRVFRGLTTALLCGWLLAPLALAAGWQTYTPDALPPVVQDAFPGQAVQLASASSTVQQGPALRPVVDALIGSWVGAQPRFFVRLLQGTFDLLALSPDGRRALALHTNEDGQATYAFQLTLKSPLIPSRAFVSVPTQEPFWNHNLPVAQPDFSSAACPEGIELGSGGVTVTTPANFPLPGGKKLLQELRCTGLEIIYTDGGQYRTASQITVRASSWERAWALVAPSSMISLITPGPFAIVNGTATVSRRYSSASFIENDVIAVQDGSALRPLLFQKQLTPWKLRPGENRFFLTTLGSSWNYISVNTQSGLVVLIRQQSMPTP